MKILDKIVKDKKEEILKLSQAAFIRRYGL